MLWKKTEWRTFLWAIPFWQPLTAFWARTTSWPLVGRISQYLINDEHYNVTFIPINQELERGESTVIPRQVVEEMIRRSAYRFALPVCMCRVGCRCEEYPMGIGCIFMGEGAQQIHPSMGRPLSVEEALHHVDRAVQSGLILQIGRVDPDPFMLGIKKKHWDRFLTLCFCCPCCCIAMRNMKSWAPEMRKRMNRLQGLRIEVTERCNGCGKCVDRCFAQAVSIEDKVAKISDECKGCGICASVCPRKAIEIRVEDGDLMLAEAFRRIQSFAEVT